MKKLISFITVFALMLCLAACGSSQSIPGDPTSQQSAGNKGPSNTPDSSEAPKEEKKSKTLVVYFSCTGNTKAVAEKIVELTGADIYEIVPENPYTDADLNYNNSDCRANKEMDDPSARPAIGSNAIAISSYDTVLIGYPNWWASIPMPIASFLEEYDFSGKTILPFCSHGGGRFGQSLTAIAKLAPDASMGEALSVHYSGGSSLSGDVRNWLKANGLLK